jgi:L-fuculose-phosphate aldolase
MARSAEDKALASQVIDTARAMNASGINQGKSGNVSVRSEDLSAMLITPSGMDYDDLTADDIVSVALKDGAAEGPLLPSSEWRMHRDIYAARPEAGAVVHTHATFSTALSCRREGIPAFHYMVAMAGGTDIRCADYATFGTQELSERMLQALDGRKACLLANHGMICLEASAKKALALAVEVETLARQYWHACQGGAPTLLSDAEMAEVLERFKSYGKQPGRKD